MPRYTSIQNYGAHNTKVISGYSESAGSSGGTAAPAPEKVNFVYGSTAGAGSSEFHVYQHARRRELDRIEYLEKDEIQKEESKAFEERRQEHRRVEDAIARKNAEKRHKRKKRKANCKENGADQKSDLSTNEKKEQSNKKKPINVYRGESTVLNSQGEDSIEGEITNDGECTNEYIRKVASLETKIGIVKSTVRLLDDDEL
jgi:hypothetical protein